MSTLDDVQTTAYHVGMLFGTLGAYILPATVVSLLINGFYAPWQDFLQTSLIVFCTIAILGIIRRKLAWP